MDFEHTKTKKIIKLLLCLVSIIALTVVAVMLIMERKPEAEIVETTKQETTKPVVETTQETTEPETKKPETVTKVFEDVDDFILDGQIAELPEDEFIPYEEEMTIDLLGLRYDEDSDFKTLFTWKDLVLENDISGYYFGMQGGCTDGVYNYFAFIVKDINKNHVDTRIVCDKIEKDENYDGPYWTVGLKDDLQHINDMTYNSITGEIVMACCQSGYYQQIYTVPAAELQSHSSQKNFVRHEVSCVVTSIGFNETRNQYVVGLSKQPNYMAILDSNFNLIKKIGYRVTVNDKKWAGQGLHCDNKYVYLTQFLDTGNSTRPQTLPYESRIKIFDWDGNHVRTIRLTVEKEIAGKPGTEERYYEVENMYVIGDSSRLGFVCAHTTYDRMFTYIDITDYTYHIQYCPDEKVEKYIERTEDGIKLKENNNVSSVMINGITTHLYKSRIVNKGKEFDGWTAYRAEADKWLYKDSAVKDSSTNVWCVEGEQPEGYVKYVFKDKQEVTNVGLGGEHIFMCARWKDATEFTVSFFSDNVENKAMRQRIVYGEPQRLSENTIVKEGRAFQGWNAYWPEVNKWYYSSPDGEDCGWYVEDCQPKGYRKYLFSDKQSISKLVFAGSNVYMYAVWNEFYVYYNANGVEVSEKGILNSMTAVHGSGIYNMVLPYQSKYLSPGYRDYQLQGYCQYWMEEDKWLCENDDGEVIGWYSQTQIDENNYVKHVIEPSSYISESVNVGDHLVLYAQWSYENADESDDV